MGWVRVSPEGVAASRGCRFAPVIPDWPGLQAACWVRTCGRVPERPSGPSRKAPSRPRLLPSHQGLESWGHWPFGSQPSRQELLQACSLPVGKVHCSPFQQLPSVQTLLRGDRLPAEKLSALRLL